MRNHGTWILLCFLMLGMGLLAVPGCPSGYGAVYNCGNPIVDRMTSDGREDPCCEAAPCPCSCINSHTYPCDATTHNEPSNIKDCHADADAGTDGGTASCEGTCVPHVPFGGWSAPGLFWIGPEGTAPDCPPQAPVAGYEGHTDTNADLPPAAPCTACECSPSSGSCGPPPAVWVSTLSCNAGSPPSITFVLPPGWETTCSAADAIAPGAICAGGPCVRSVSAAPVPVIEQGCTASVAVPVSPTPPSWKTAVLGCGGTNLGDCIEHDQTCAPSAAPSAATFMTCILHDGIEACPDGYPITQLIYSHFDDQRGCTECQCGAPDSLCQATLDVFTHAGCHDADKLPLVELDSLGNSLSNGCIDLPAGSALGSMDLQSLPYQAGTCASSGGASTGAVNPAGASTLCCLATS